MNFCSSLIPEYDSLSTNKNLGHIENTFTPVHTAEIHIKKDNKHKIHFTEYTIRIILKSIINKLSFK